MALISGSLQRDTASLYYLEAFNKQQRGFGLVTSVPFQDVLFLQIYVTDMKLY